MIDGLLFEGAIRFKTGQTTSIGNGKDEGWILTVVPVFDIIFLRLTTLLTDSDIRLHYPADPRSSSLIPQASRDESVAKNGVV
jgi:hypothetical protein